MTNGPHSWMRSGTGGAKVTPTLWQHGGRRHIQEGDMARTIRCECGYVARGESDDDVITTIRAHMSTDHPALLDSVGREDLLGWIQVE
jgi:predicted small metal-binding protein